MNGFFKNIPKKKIIYSLLFVIFVVCAALIFVRNVAFLSRAIDDALRMVTTGEEAALSIDTERVGDIAEKLGLSVLSPDEAPPEERAEEMPGDTIVVPQEKPLEGAAEADIVMPSAEEEEQAPDKQSLSLSVLNGTGIPRLATGLAEALAAQGYRVDDIGNNPAQSDKTVIKIKIEKSEYADGLLAAVGKQYEVSEIADLEETSPYGAVIIIGSD